MEQGVLIGSVVGLGAALGLVFVVGPLLGRRRRRIALQRAEDGDLPANDNRRDNWKASNERGKALAVQHIAERLREQEERDADAALGELASIVRSDGEPGSQH